MKTTIIAANEAGTALVSLGKNMTIPIVNATKPAIINRGLPDNQTLSPFTIVLNCSSCDMKMIIAKPFTNPNITGCGTNRMNLPNLNKPIKICITPAKATAANTYSKPFDCIKAIKTITVAPAPPDTIPGLPPKTAVTKPIMKAAYNPTSGGKPANIANDNDSGIMVMATVNPAKTSVL